MKQAMFIIRPPVVLLCVCILSFTGFAYAQSGVPLKDRYQSQSNRTAIDYYSERLEPYYGEIAKDLPLLPKTADAGAVVLSAHSATSGDADLRRIRRAGGRSGVFAEWPEGVDWVEWRFTIARRGVYEIDLDYFIPPFRFITRPA